MRLWNWDDCYKWINEQCVQFQLQTPNVNLFSTSLIQKTCNKTVNAGETFLTLSTDDFCNLMPEGGDTLHAQLQLWKTGNQILINSFI